MLTKSKQQLQHYRLCALLILAACCFRTLSVLTEPKDTPRPAVQAQIEPMAYESLEAPSFVVSPDPPDLSLVDIDNRCGAVFAEQELFDLPLHFTITEEPCVLIIHTHGSEAYSDTPGYRSTDPEKNMVRIGKEMAQQLNAAGIPTIHDTTLHDETRGYDMAYSQAASAISAYLEQYPQIQMVIDIHRDAVEDSKGTQKAMTTEIDGRSYAQLLLVMGTDLSGQAHPRWEENLSFAMKLQAQLRMEHPDFMRQTSLRSSRYNEHLTPFSILLEVGSAGNTQEEALRSADYFALQLAQLLKTIDASS
ncbi:MAG: stage II sporulation protein P [Oscillospiraceae bacterium]|nr:stage II sporulation protein P [Oscillospiraceae bacterium]